MILILDSRQQHASLAVAYADASACSGAVLEATLLCLFVHSGHNSRQLNSTNTFLVLIHHERTGSGTAEKLGCMHGDNAAEMTQ